jgi:hypothetical protein
VTSGLPTRDPEIGDPVILRGTILRIEEGIAIVEVYRTYPLGLRIPVQCGALEFDEVAASYAGGVHDDTQEASASPAL